MPKHYSKPTSRAIPFDNTSNGFDSTNAQNAIEELFNTVTTSASPGFSFGRSGNVTSGAYLQNETVPSNVSGRWVYISNAAVKRIFVTNENTTTYKIEILYHDGNESGLTSLGSITVTTAKGGSFAVDWPVPTNKQIAVRLATDSPNSAKNLVVGLQLAGTT